MTTRSKKTIEIWDRCECGKVLHSILEGTRGTCSSCWYAAMPSDTKKSLDKLISAAFRPSTESERDGLVDDSMAKLKRDEETRKGTRK